jgi:hypothetical protein
MKEHSKETSPFAGGGPGFPKTVDGFSLAMEDVRTVQPALLPQIVQKILKFRGEIDDSSFPIFGGPYLQPDTSRLKVHAVPAEGPDLLAPPAGEVRECDQRVEIFWQVLAQPDKIFPFKESFTLGRPTASPPPRRGRPIPPMRMFRSDFTPKSSRSEDP